ncbi:MAG: phosphatase PAP2 family protein, partial [Candidatus Nanohaloarchaea archaeon]
YEFHPYINQGITTFDPLTKALPSLHTGISFLAFAYSAKYTETFRYYAGLLTGLIIFSTFYLGVHWITDAILGALLAFTSFYIFDSGLIGTWMVPDRFVELLEDFSDEIQFRFKKR